VRTAIFIKRRHLVAVKPRDVPPDQVLHPLAALPTIKPPSPLLWRSRVIFLSSVTRGFLDRPSPAAAPLQLPSQSPFPPSMSDFGPTFDHTDCAGRCSYSPTLRSRLSRQQTGCDTDRAMEYPAFQARWLPHALALDPHARLCSSFSYVI
jgi:hypothetical protein